MDVDPGSLRPSPLAISTAQTHDNLASASAAHLSPLPYAMHISVEGTTRTLILKMDDSFMTDFSN
ncbi:hypothetical protein PENARI_c217G10964, partial [Penicillium arizonense]